MCNHPKSAKLQKRTNINYFDIAVHAALFTPMVLQKNATTVNNPTKNHCQYNYAYVTAKQKITTSFADRYKLEVDRSGKGKSAVSVLAIFKKIKLFFSELDPLITCACLPVSFGAL